MTTTEAMSRRTARGVAAGLLALVAVGSMAGLVSVGHAEVLAAGADTASVDPVSTDGPPVTAVAPTMPATTPPDSQTSTPSPGSVPLASEPTADEGGDLGPITWFAVGAAGVLLAVAVWWMLRRPDDDQLHADPYDSDWPAGTDVI